MSRAFVKEGDGSLEPLPDLPISSHPNYVTRRGLAALQARLLVRQEALADLKSRADRLDKLPEAAAERDIRYLEARLKSAIPVDPPADLTAVAFGLRVRVAGPQGTAWYEITGEDEADPALGRIAPQSPLARALIGAELGDTVQWRRPSGVVTLDVLEISHADPAA
ncbi:GreA/GreB family elongation factor [Rhodobacter sp. KR11]|uniref:GreA/GreB family elongation factor n=1 Tax=Rhodobacter sp. KR11 TaxID=2974588 RepID=UPI00222280CF|nr:GreA/GreB family elongation factor [Rhodobacter sp. KR11]MCW1918716.1 GreA/GreB family elongation factor [Rhodobacter sp. KR11]